MLRRSSNTSKRNKTKIEMPHRSFDKSLLNKAKRIADTYSIVLNPDTRLGFIGTSIELPTVFVDSETMQQCCQTTREALKIAVATMIECGQHPPPPASARRRTVQVNIRLTMEEKEKLVRVSKNLGFKGVSDFVRFAALKAVASNSM